MKARSFTIVIDSREQRPFDFGPGVQTKRGTLTTGDYSILHLEDLISIERKSLDDLAACCCGSQRLRFKKELHRLQAYRGAAVIIEGTAADILNGNYRSSIRPQSVIGSLCSWTVQYRIPFILAGDHGPAFCLSTLANFHRRLTELCKKLNVGEAVNV